MLQQRRVLGQPRPFDTVVDIAGQARDLSAAEMLAAREYAADEHRRIDGRHLGIPNALARFDIGEMIIKPAMVRHRFPEKPQGSQHALARIGGRYVAPLLSDAKGRESEARGGDTADDAVVVASHMTAVLDEAGLRVRLFPEKPDVCSFEFIQKRIVFR